MGCKCSSLLAKLLHSFFGWVSYLPSTSAFCWLPMLAWQPHWLAVLALHYPSPNALSQTLLSDKRKTAQGGDSFVVSLGGPTSDSHFRLRHSGTWWSTVLCQSGKWTWNSLSIECAPGIGEISASQLAAGGGRGEIDHESEGETSQEEEDARGRENNNLCWVRKGERAINIQAAYLLSLMVTEPLSVQEHHHK